MITPCSWTGDWYGPWSTLPAGSPCADPAAQPGTRPCRSRTSPPTRSPRQRRIPGRIRSSRLSEASPAKSSSRPGYRLPPCDPGTVAAGAGLRNSFSALSTVCVKPQSVGNTTIAHARPSAAGEDFLALFPVIVSPLSVTCRNRHDVLLFHPMLRRHRPD